MSPRKHAILHGTTPRPWHLESVTLPAMNNPMQPNVKLSNDASYRENYANSVQMRVNIWDFFLVFGTLQQQSETNVEIRNFQGIYLSPQQAKALLGLLQQNVVELRGRVWRDQTRSAHGSGRAGALAGMSPVFARFHD